MKRNDLNMVLNKFATQCFNLYKEKDNEYKFIEFTGQAIPFILDNLRKSIDYELTLIKLTKIEKEACAEVEQDAIETKKIIDRLERAKK